MPDWVYRTVAQRVLFALPDEVGRAVALGTIGTLGTTSVGRAIIEFMGHMAPDPRLRTSVAGVTFPSPFGLGWRVDPERRATAGLSCFGVGWIEVQQGATRNVRRVDGEALRDEPAARSFRQGRPGLAGVPLLERSIDPSGQEWVRFPNGITLPVVALDTVPAAETPTGGVLLQAGSANADRCWTVPLARPDALLESIRAWRARLGPAAPILVSGGVGTPSDAVAAIEAGANLILLEAPLVYRGPGFIKRCNAALGRRFDRAHAEGESAPLFRCAWFWSVALGSAMALGGVLTLALALSRVLLPYDEHYLGFDAALLQRNSPRLFAFMAHDRATLAGTMLGLGWLYVAVAWSAIRRGRHGARTAVIASACAGFVSFFAFFGFGYFDTLHAFVAAVLLQLTIQIMVGQTRANPIDSEEIDDEDAAWRAAQWGQLLWVIHGAGLLIAGAVILSIGMTSVFVSEDLNFLCLTLDQARELGTRLVAVVAHDRATLGGMLLATGVAMLLLVLWCFQRGAAWLWRSMLGLGTLAYAAAIGIHLWVGYTDWRHMVPALAGLTLWLGGLLFSRRYLCSPPRV